MSFYAGDCIASCTHRTQLDNHRKSTVDLFISFMFFLEKHLLVSQALII